MNSISILLYSSSTNPPSVPFFFLFLLYSFNVLNVFPFDSTALLCSISVSFLTGSLGPFSNNRSISCLASIFLSPLILMTFFSLYSFSFPSNSTLGSSLAIVSLYSSSFVINSINNIIKISGYSFKVHDNDESEADSRHNPVEDELVLPSVSPDIFHHLLGNRHLSIHLT